jgi:hypothetical protein
MQEEQKEHTNKNLRLEELPQEQQRGLVGFFVLLIKVDKRTNPHLYKNNEETL